jgi:hypothetical protein
MGYIFTMIAITVGLFALIFYLDDEAVVNVTDFNVSCIDGVEYWYGQSGYKGYIAPRIDSSTLNFVRCDE